MSTTPFLAYCLRLQNTSRIQTMSTTCFFIASHIIHTIYISSYYQLSLLSI
ncbi:hypothetical protein [Diatraea saccharalis granulovirus]|uniref:Uncharacterized protein n=1 Tax=Diatraea saccharalis granulovirus TaxID=1675862 RepID=A0A0R7EYQ2_9BBAC|nr:hypothetical protein [Diatraea saccharalis granulovirus]AKN80715.1 hypothetical protein [Diatraea saccharalis granulovirus]